MLGHKFSLFLQTSGQFLWTKIRTSSSSFNWVRMPQGIFFPIVFYYFRLSLLTSSLFIIGCSKICWWRIFGTHSLTFYRMTKKKLQKFVDLSWNGELRIVLANYWTTLWISCLENLIVYSMFYVDCHGPGHNHIVYKLVTDSLCPFLPPPCYIPLQCYTQLTFGCEGRTNWSTRGVCMKFCRFSFFYISLIQLFSAI